MAEGWAGGHARGITRGGVDPDQSLTLSPSPVALTRSLPVASQDWWEEVVVQTDNSTGLPLLSALRPTEAGVAGWNTMVAFCDGPTDRGVFKVYTDLQVAAVPSPSTQLAPRMLTSLHSPHARGCTRTWQSHVHHMCTGRTVHLRTWACCALPFALT